MRRMVAVATLAACLAACPAFAQNDWQFPDPYFGALEFGVSRPTVTRSSRAATALPSRPKPTRQRPHRGRQRWSQQGSRP